MNNLFYSQPKTQYALTSDSALKDMFHHDTWVTLNESQRLDLLQEVVNREVEKSGGKYFCRVNFSDLPSNIAGEQRGSMIFLNRQMYVEDQLTEEYNGRVITYNLSDSNYNAYETVLHEHQHVKQDMIAMGVVPSDPLTREVFLSNSFTASDVDGARGSQYMFGVTHYSLYYLNPTELDAYKTSQEATRKLVAEHVEKYGEDFSSSHYVSYLSKNGYEAKLDEYRVLYANDQIEKEVENVLINQHTNSSLPVDSQIEKIVKNEMVKSGALLYANKSEKEAKAMADETFTDNGFTFKVEKNGTTTAEGKVSDNPASRNGMASIHPSSYDSQVDDKGHLIAARMNGPAKSYNVSSQNRALNRGAYKSVENGEIRLAKQGNDVHTSKTAYVSNEGAKPDAYMINDTITTPEGKTQNMHFSFQNASPGEQQEWNDIADLNTDFEAYSNPDPLREGMTSQQYNELMESTDAFLPSIHDDFTVENSSGEPAQSGFEAASNGSVSDGAAAGSCGADAGADGGSADGGCDDGCSL